MIDIKKLDMDDIIAICRIIGLEEINRFMKENHISSRMVTGKTMLGYSQKGAAPFPMAFAVMYDHSRNDKQVIAFFEDKIESIVSGIRNNITEKNGATSEIYFSLISEINSIFDGNEALFCKIVEVENIMEYVEVLSNNKTNPIGTKNIDINPTVSLCSRMQITVHNLKKADFEQIINVIGTSTMGKIVPGMWINSYSGIEIKNYLYNNRNEKTVCNFIKSRVDEVLKTISIRFIYYYDSYKNIETAIILALYESPFKNNPKLYYKLTGQNSNEQILYQLNAMIKLPRTASELISGDKIIDTEEMQDKIAHLEDIIRQDTEKAEQQKAEYEAQIAYLENSKKQSDEALIAAEAEKVRLLEINKEYEEKATVKNEATMLSSEKETLLTEIKHLEERKNELANDVKQIEEEHTQLIAKRIQLQNKLDDEIKRFSDDFAHSTAISAFIQKLNQTSTAKGSATSILIEMPENNIPNATHEEDLLLMTDILADNLFAAGIQKNNDELAKMLISTIIGKGNFIIYGSGQENIADAVSLALFAEYAAHVVLPTDISDIPYFINEINGIQRSVVYIENALDSFSDRLCNSLIKHCKDKIFVFAVNDNDSLRSIKGSFAFEKCLYLNSELFTDYLAKPDYKANKCNLSLYQEDPDVFTRIIENDYVKQLVKIIRVSPSVYRFWIRIAANYGNKYNTKFRRNIVVELIASIMIKDGLCSGTIENLRNFVNENEDTKLDLLDTIIAEDTEDESD